MCNLFKTVPIQFKLLDQFPLKDVFNYLPKGSHLCYYYLVTDLKIMLIKFLNYIKLGDIINIMDSKSQNCNRVGIMGGWKYKSDSMEWKTSDPCKYSEIGK